MRIQKVKIVTALVERSSIEYSHQTMSLQFIAQLDGGVTLPMSVDSSSIKNTPTYNGQYDAIVTKVIEGLVDHYKLPHTDHSVLMGTHDIRVNVTLASVEQDFTLGHTTTTSRFVELAMDAIDDEEQYVLEGVTCTPLEFVENLQGREFALVSKALDLLGIEYTCRSAESFARLINAGEDNFSASYVIAVWEVS